MNNTERTSSCNEDGTAPLGFIWRPVRTGRSDDSHECCADTGTTARSSGVDDGDNGSSVNIDDEPLLPNLVVPVSRGLQFCPNWNRDVVETREETKQRSGTDAADEVGSGDGCGDIGEDGDGAQRMDEDYAVAMLGDDEDGEDHGATGENDDDIIDVINDQEADVEDLEVDMEEVGVEMNVKQTVKRIPARRVMNFLTYRGVTRGRLGSRKSDPSSYNAFLWPKSLYW